MTERGSARSDPFEGVHQTARTWLRTVAQQLGTEDETYAHRVLRAWLHTVRDQLSVDVAAHVAAQLPVLLRGVFFEGWAPRRVPVAHDAEQFLLTVAQEARISLPQAGAAVAAVTRALEELTSPDLVVHVLTPLPATLRAVLSPGAPVPVPAEAEAPEPAEMFAEEPAMPAPRAPSSAPASAPPAGDDRLSQVERELQVVSEALRALVADLDQRPTDEPEPQRSVAAARRAHRILLTSRGVEA